MKRILYFRLMCLLFMLSAATLDAQENVENQPEIPAKADERISKQLDSLGYKYTVNDKGDFKLICRLGDDRTQVVFINSSTQNFQDIEIREIFSPAALLKASDFSVPFLKKLLEENYNKKIGAWQMISGNESSLITYTVKADANCPALELNKIIWLVAQTAEELEIEISPEDNY